MSRCALLTVVVAIAAAALLAAGCRRAATPSAEEVPAQEARQSPWFVETAAEMGLDFVHRSGHDGRRFLLPESASGGGALFDMDGDGFLDVYLVQGAEPATGSGEAGGNRLYRNLGGDRFVDVTAASGAGIGGRGYGMGVATGDYDSDGDVDLYVTNVGPNVLLRNDGGADGTVTFTDVTLEAGVGDTGFGTSAAFLDVDRDGDLDLWVVNYVVWSEEIERRCRNKLGEPDYCDPNEYDAPAPDVLYRNDGRDANGVVRFTDVSLEAGLRGAFGNGLGVVASNFDGDGRTDVFVANDRNPDQLWVNVGDAEGGVRFVENGLVAGCSMDEDGLAKAGMGVDAEDVDDDGDFDLMVGNFSDESDSFFRNEGSFFVDVTARVGLKSVSRPFTRFGLGLLDFDNDGLLDLFQATGRVSRQERRYGGDPYAEPNLLFRGTRTQTGQHRFEDVQPRGGTAGLLAFTSRAAAFGDVDNDGAVDVLVVNRDGPVHLLRNVTAGRGHWVSFRVLDEHGSDALGAVVRLAVGDRRVVREVRSAFSFLAASDPRVHVGLGRATGVEEVSVRWPDGTLEPFGDFAAGQVWALRRGRGSRDPTRNTPPR